MKKTAQKTSSGTEDGHAPKLQYVVTQTVSGMLHALKTTGLTIPPADKIARCEDIILNSIRSCLPQDGTEVISIPMEEQCDKISVAVHKARKSAPTATIVSTAPLLSFENGGICIEMSRIVDLRGNMLGIGSRPGHPSITRQLVRCNKMIEGQPVIIAEDGSFTGTSLRHLITKLQGQKARIQAIVVGVLFPQAEKTVREVYSGEIISCFDFSAPLDWMPTHDFLPFVPNSGRVVGFKMDGNAFPIHLHEGASICMPYIRPYGKPDEWASLDGDQHSLNRFNLSCMHQAYDLFEEMERLNGKEILISDVYDSNPRTSIPVSPVSGSPNDPAGFSDLSERIVSLLGCEMDSFS